MRSISAPLFQAYEAECKLHTGRVDAAGESEPVQFSEAPGRVYLTAHAALRSGRLVNAEPTLTLTVEDSADGETWATLASFDLHGNDPQDATVEPRAYMRARWTLDDGQWDATVEAVAIDAASNGGSMPSTETATITINRAGGFATAHVFDLGHAAVVNYQVTVVSTIADGETWGIDPGTIELFPDDTTGSGGGALETSFDGVTYLVADRLINGGQSLFAADDVYDGVIASARYFRPKVSIIDADFALYAGANNPVAVVRIDVEYV